MNNPQPSNTTPHPTAPVYYTNVDNSLLSKIDLLHAQIQDQEPEIIALTEIKPKNGKIPDLKLLEINGYTLHLSNLDAIDTRGACIYVSNKYKSVKIKGNHNYNDAAWVSIYGDNHKQRILVGCVYRSGTPTTAAKYDEHFNNMIINMSNMPSFTQKYCFGDFNYNKIQWTPQPIPPSNSAEDSPEVKFVECVRDAFLYQHIYEPTRYRDGQRPTIDDLLFSTEQNSVSKINHQSPLGKSDHEAITCEIQVKPLTHKSNKISYAYDKGRYNQLREMLNIDWNTELQELSTQEAMNRFETLYKEAVDQCIPKNEFSPKRKNKPIWLNQSALRKCRKKHSAWIRYLNTKNGDNYANYIQERNAANKEVRKSRKEFEKKLAKECKANAKGVWKYIKKQRKSGNAMPDLKKKDGSYTTNDQEAAEALNQQYYDTFTKEDLANLPDIETKPLLTEPLRGFDISRERVLKVIKQLKINKSPGIDGIHPRVLKELEEVISNPTTLIYQKSVNSSQLPKQWKDAEITPIFKKENRSLPKNYRPVSLTSIICKILEKMIVEDIINHINANQLNCEEQHGFTPHKSTTTNLLETLNVIVEAQMHGIPVDLLFLDYQKAFDTVPHHRLLLQLKSFGIEDQALEWIRQFLKDRRQRVRVNDSISSWKPVESGIPQGSILGPILFILYVNDIPSQLKSIIAMYADDTKLYSAILSDNPNNTLISDLKIMEQWSQRFQMKFHPEKCHVMHIGAKNPRQEYTMTKDNEQYTLESVSLEKDLGVLLDDKLTFTEHINTKINKANQILGCIRHTFKHMNKEIFLLLYKSLVRPHLEYGSCIWSPHLKRDIDAIEKVQRRATRMLPDIRHLSYTERLRELKLPTLKFRRERSDIIETYNILTKKHLVNLDCRCHLCPEKQMFQKSLSTNNRGNTMTLRPQRDVGNRFHFLARRVLNTWNSLPENTVTQPTVQKFKTELHRHWDHNTEVYYTHRFSY